MQAILLVAVLVVQTTLAPAPAPSPSSLPEIGRVKVVAPTCATIVDVVLPAYDAVADADHAFNDAVPSLAKYAENAVRVRHPGIESDVLGNMYISRIGQAAANQLRALQLVDKALADPRLAGPPGSIADAERQHLEALYEIELARTLALHEFWVEHAAEAGRDEMNDMIKAMTPNQTLRADIQFPSTALAPGVRPAAFDPKAFNQPIVSSSLELAARADIVKWAAGMTTQVTLAKDATSRFFLPIAQKCDSAANAAAP